MNERILGLAKLRLTPSHFFRLPSRRITLRIYLRNWDITPAIISLEPRKRQPYQEKRWRLWFAQIQKTFPMAIFQPNSAISLPSSLVTRLSLREIKRLIMLPSVHSILVEKISGYPQARKPKLLSSWYCVRATVAIQIEGQTRGMQSVEDRFVIVRALSFKDAERRLQAEWRKYATPYLNSDSLLVRWRLEKVVDVYEIADDKIDPRGTEVFSELKSRRMKPSYAWHPRNRRRGPEKPSRP
jgi:hypothetical protein